MQIFLCLHRQQMRWIHYVFGLSVRSCVCVCACIRVCILLTWYFTEFHQTFVDDVLLVEVTDKLIRFLKLGSHSRSHQGQTFQWIIAAGRHIHIGAWASKYHLVLRKSIIVTCLITLWKMWWCWTQNVTIVVKLIRSSDFSFCWFCCYWHIRYIAQRSCNVKPEQIHNNSKK